MLVLYALLWGQVHTLFPEIPVRRSPESWDSVEELEAKESMRESDITDWLPREFLGERFTRRLQQ